MINNSTLRHYALPASLTHEVRSRIAERSGVCKEAQCFLESATIEKFIEGAKNLVSSLKNSPKNKKHLLPYNLTPTHIACLAQDIEFLKAVFNTSNWDSSIDQCTVALDKEILAVLGDNKNIPAMNHDTALHFALFTGWNEGALELIDKLKLANKLEFTINNTGNSVLNLAVASSNIDVVQKLCEHFSTSNEYKKFLFHQTDNGSTLLHHAALQPNPEIFEFILKEQKTFGQDTLATQDKAGNSPMDLMKEKKDTSWEYINLDDCKADYQHTEYASSMWCHII